MATQIGPEPLAPNGGDNKTVLFIILGCGCLVVLAIAAVILLAVLLPNIIHARSQAMYQADVANEEQIGAALDRFNLEHGAYPKSLAALVPQYLSHVPSIPGSGKAYIYHMPAIQKSYGAYDIYDQASMYPAGAGSAAPCDRDPCYVVFSQARGLMVMYPSGGRWTEREATAGRSTSYDGSSLYVEDVENSGQFGAAADLDLPQVPADTAATFLFLVLTTYPPRGESDTDQPYVQVGIARTPRQKFRPEIFYTIRARKSESNYQLTPNFLAPGYHRFAVASSADLLVLSADGKPMFKQTSPVLFASSDRLYVQIVAAVSSVGDIAAGDVRDIRMLRPTGASLRPYPVTCIFEDRGIYWSQQGDDYHASGRFELNVPTKWRTRDSGCLYGR